MTLEELDEVLPNGLHDAQIKAIAHNYERAVVKLDVRILVGLPDDPPPNRFRYRDGEILFHMVLFSGIEIPENDRILGHPGSIWSVFGRMDPGFLPEKIAKSLPPEALCYSLYILEWESHIHIAAADVSFSWSSSGEAPARE